MRWLKLTGFLCHGSGDRLLQELGLVFFDLLHTAARYSASFVARPLTLLFCFCLASCLLFSGYSHADSIDPESISAMEWRNVGPFRGGRATDVEGVPSQPFTFYMGAPGGGVWKTTDGGTSWNNISDGYFNTGSVGAIAVSLSDPNVIYVGMGEHCVRDVTVSHGDGVYKSTDGGKSWSHIGLPKTLHISSVQIHPADPDIVYVGAQGSPWGPHPERGVYKSSDGGKSWSLLLHSNNTSGINDLVMDPNNPRILYAAMWDHDREPWHGYQMNSGGPGSALYKSTDAGESWQKLSKGFPSSVGKFAVAVSAADSNRLYALVEAKPAASGVYVSNDAGDSWTQVNKEHVMTERSAYYMHIAADPLDRDVVYVLNAPFLKSIDGGKTFSRQRVPHGDNHAIWIHPQHSDWMIEANDGGVNVSYNGGETWSTQGNQPTAQFYRINADNLFPYNLYGGQQDNSTVKIKSRNFGSGIGVEDWYPVGGGESAHVAFDRDNPQLIYAGNYQGQITEYDDRNGVERDIRRYPLGTAYRRPEEYPFRFNWNAPIVVSQHDPAVIYHGAQMVLKSVDRGQNWQEISSDLTRNDKQHQGVVEGEFTFEGTAGAMYNTIFYIAESPHTDAELWVGTDDGSIYLTRDGGENWQAITPEGIGEAQINMIELSPHEAGKAYAVVTRYKFDDRSPSIFRTDNYGKSWSQIASNLPAGDWVRVVREDTVKPGLLFAGTQTSAYVSADDGGSWSSLQLNLPHVPVTDLKVHKDDLLAATEGRAFWILDDLSVLRQMSSTTSTAKFHLYQPAATEQVQIEGWGGAAAGVGKNPPSGSIIYYSFDAAPDLKNSPVSLQILTADGELLNTIKAGEGGSGLTTKAGLNRFVWNWQVAGMANKEPDLATYRAPLAYRVQPERYTARLQVGDQSTSQSFEVLDDPRTPVNAADAARKQELLAAIYAEAAGLRAEVINMRTVRSDVEAMSKIMSRAQSPEYDAAQSALLQEIDGWLVRVVEEGDENFVEAGHSPSRLDFSLFEILNLVDRAATPLNQGVLNRVADVRARYRVEQDAYNRILSEELAKLNSITSEQSVPAILPNGS